MTKRERVAFAGFLLLAFGVEMVVVQQAVLRDRVAAIVVKRWGDEGVAAALAGASGRRIALPVPDAIGHCVATSGFVLILCCYILLKPDE
ncbi:MAG: hypothetical protein IKK39_02920 [Thermoguttaceae bacterium]|nr:hypothetical protein [Thermoguttaceae bacterium]MBR4102999.1 hypothetical protein [Thermoguttaceae bacterium]